MRRLIPCVHKFGKDNRGSIALIFGLSVLILFGTVGLAVDGGRAYSAATKLTAAADAAALAAAKMLDDTSKSDGEIKAFALNIFTSNTEQLGLGDIDVSNFLASINRPASKVIVTTDVKVMTTFGNIVGVDSINFTPTATVVYKTKKIELALVLDVTGSMGGAKLDALKTAAKDLIDSLFASAPGYGAVKVSMVPYSGSVNAGAFAGAASGGASTDGCVVERTGPSAYTDDAPGAGTNSSVSDTTQNPGYSCPGDEVVPLTDLYLANDRNDFKASIDALTAGGWTAGHIGTAWGLYTVSPEWNSVFSGSYARPYDPEKVIKAVVVMTDGMFNTAYKNGGEAYASGSPESVDRTITGTSGYQALQICNNMRTPINAGEEVRVYTIAFQASAPAEDLLKECSGEANFLTAETAGELGAAFQKIVEKLTTLRITK